MNNLTIKFPHKQGTDCATAAMRNLLAFYGLELSEEMVFGLGEGLSFWCCNIASFPVLLGQNLFVEKSLCQNLNIGLTILENDDILDRVRGGEPTIAKVDPYYLDYCWDQDTIRGHFGEHILVVVAIEKEDVWVSDIWSDQLVKINLESLQKARSTKEGMDFLLPRNRWYKIDFPIGPILIEDKLLPIIRTTIHKMVSSRGFFGVQGIKNSGKVIMDWFLSVDRKIALEGLEIIILRMEEGARGSCFRQLFSNFLIESGNLLNDDRLVLWGERFQVEIVALWQGVVKELKFFLKMSHEEQRKKILIFEKYFKEIAQKEENFYFDMKI